jgi:hypothetical protein
MTRFAAFRIALALAAWAAAILPAQAQFSLAVSPPRFELSAKAGQRVSEVLELTHRDERAGGYKLKTADWTLRPDGSVDFSDELLPGSCRPGWRSSAASSASRPGGPTASASRWRHRPTHRRRSAASP